MESTQIKNAIVWFDIPTTDFNRAVKFYSDVFGEPIQVTEYQGQTLAFFPQQGTGAVGANLVPPMPNFKPGDAGSRVYLNLDGKLDEALGRVEKAGGKIVQPKWHMPEVGFLAMIQDTEGNVVGLWSNS